MTIKPKLFIISDNGKNQRVNRRSVHPDACQRRHQSRSNTGICRHACKERPQGRVYQRLVRRRLHAHPRRAHGRGREMDGLSARGIQGNSACRQLLSARKRCPCGPCRENRRMGHRLDGASVPENRTHRGAGEILRGDSRRRSLAPILLLPHTRLQRRVPPHDRAAQGCRRTHTQLRRHQIHI